MMVSNLVIRPAGPDDAEVIAKVYVESWNAGFQTRMPVIEANAVRVERWHRDLSDVTPTRWWVAEQAGSVVGFVGIGPCRDPVDATLGELDTIAGSPAVWRSGIGKALMDTALEALRSDGYLSAALWTLSHYPLGESFYVSTGWRLNGATRDRSNQVRYDHDLRASDDLSTSD